MIVKPSTLEELGWVASWDAQGKNPIKEGDSFKVTPGSTVDICYTSKPVQHENGKWYSNRLIIHKPIPGLIGGVYRKERIINTSFLCGDGTPTGAIDGRIEEIAYWGDSIGVSGLIDYQTNKTAMFGAPPAALYENEQEAIDAKLYYYYNFSDSTQVIQNFTQDGGVAVKSSFFDIGAGKMTNSTIMHGGDENIRIEQHHSEKNISFNIRFFIEKYKDFVLYKNKNTFEIKYDASNETFYVKTFPYIGNSITYAIETPQLGIHRWHDFGVDYNNGVLSVVLNGKKLEEHRPNIAIGGVESLKLDMENVESIEVYGVHEGLRLRANNANSDSVRGDSFDEETNQEGVRQETLYFDSGADNAFNLVFDRNTRRPALITWVANDYIPDVNVIDVVTDRISLDVWTNGGGEIAYCNGYRKYWDFWWKMAETEDGRFFIQNREAKAGSTHTCCCTYYSRLYWHNFLFAGSTVRIRVKFKNQLTSEEPVYPMLTLFPGSKVKVDAMEMDPDLPNTIKNNIINSGNWGYYNGDHRYPGFRNTSGRTLYVRIPNTSNFTMVWNGYICYRTGDNVVQTSYDSRYRKISRDDNANPGFSIEVER